MLNVESGKRYVMELGNNNLRVHKVMYFGDVFDTNIIL